VLASIVEVIDDMHHWYHASKIKPATTNYYQ